MIESPRENIDFRFALNDALRIFFRDAIRVTLRHPSQALFFLKTYRWQKKAARIREEWEQEGVYVPPIMIFSITHQCNLNCPGCYEKAIRPPSTRELTDEKLRSTIGEAHELGISFVVVAGGEPFTRPAFFEITRDFPDIIFLIFTNGLLIRDEILEAIKRQKNIVPLISLEGCEEETDEMRGEGIYGRLLKIMKKINDRRIFFGTSLTLTRNNFDTVTGEPFIQDLMRVGCRFFLFVEYNPIKPGTEKWMVTQEQGETIMGTVKRFREKWPALFVAVPGDEDEIGGCLAAGRGFIHVSAEGDVEPCPFAPYSDMNLNSVSLRDALNSRFLKKIRERHAQLHGTDGSCGLWANRQMVRALLRETE